MQGFQGTSAGRRGVWISRLRFWAPLGLIALLALLFCRIHPPYTYDDAYITYRYARNFALGHGFVYNVGDRFLGTSAPLYGLLLGILGWPAPDSIPALSAGLSALAIALTGMGLFWMGWYLEVPFCGLLAALFYVLDPILYETLGGEMVFQVALVVWAFACLVARRPTASAVLLALATLTRPDAIIAAVIFAGYGLLRDRRLPLAAIAVYGLVLLPFLIAAKLYYGAFLPDTLAAKSAQLASGHWPSFLRGSAAAFRQRWRTVPAGTLYPWLPLLGLPFLPRFRDWTPLILWPAAVALVYKVLNVPFYHWYLVPLVLGLAVLSALAVAGVIETILRLRQSRHPEANPDPKRPSPNAQRLLQMAVVLVLLVVAGARARYQAALRAHPPDYPHYLQNVHVAQWLRAQTPPAASVGYEEIGIIGYFSDRPIVDALGLVTPLVAAQIRQAHFEWAFEHYRPDYILAKPQNDPFLPPHKPAPWKQAYRKVTVIFQPGMPPMTVYKRQNR